MAYVDGFVLAVPTGNLDAYRALAERMAPLFREYGGWGDDVPEGEVTSFPMAVKCKEDETVVFSWIVWPSRDARKTAWDRMMQDERFQPGANEMPFDGKRMIFGGFEVIVDE
jgi:uncharacterized protein YbaA (DUF1428 family)